MTRNSLHPRLRMRIEGSAVLVFLMIERTRLTTSRGYC